MEHLRRLPANPEPSPEITYDTVSEKAKWYGMRLITITVDKEYVIEDHKMGYFMYRGTLQQADTFLNALEK
jgi:hypothetical protein